MIEDEPLQPWQDIITKVWKKQILSSRLAAADAFNASWCSAGDITEETRTESVSGSKPMKAQYIC